MRKQVDALVRQSTETDPPPAAVEPEAKVTIDDLYEDPEAVIEKVVERRLAPAKEAMRKESQAEREYNKQLAKIDSDYGNWREDIGKPEFSQWVQEKPYRQNMAAHVRDNNDLYAADDLLAQYYDQQGSSAEAAKEEKRQADLKSAETVSGGAAFSEPEEMYSRSELLNVRVRAKQGDRQAATWLQAHGDAIAIAYEEGRITD